MLLWLIPLGLAVGLGLYGYRQYEQIRSKPQVTIGLVQTMTSGEAEKLLSAKGYLKSRNQALIGAKIPGRVERMFVEEGTKVKKGQVLAILEHNELKAMLAARRATVQRTEAELLEARADARDKDRKAKRAVRLYNQRTVSVEEVEQADTERDMAAARVAALEAAIALEKANVQEIEENIRNMHLFAPFDGTVVEKQGEEGEIITPGAMSATISRSAVVSLANLDRMDVETDIAEKLLSRVAIGQPAEISVSAIPSKHYRGRLRQIIPMGDRTRGTIKVKVEILDPDQSPLPRARGHRPLPARQGDPQPGREPGLPVRPQGGALRGERPHVRLGRRRRGEAPETPRRGGGDERRPGPRRVGPEVGRIGRHESPQDLARRRSGQGRGLDAPER